MASSGEVPAGIFLKHSFIVSTETLKQLQIALPLGFSSTGGLLTAINKDLPSFLASKPLSRYSRSQAVLARQTGLALEHARAVLRLCAYRYSASQALQIPHPT